MPEDQVNKANLYATKEALENSLAMQLLTMFSVLAKTEESVSKAKKEFVRMFYDNLYPTDITEFFCRRFEENLTESIDLERFARDLNYDLSYQEKIFCLLTLYEFVQAGERNPLEVEMTRKLAKRIRIHPSDIAFMEHNVGLAESTPEVLAESNILALRVTGDLETADVYLPFPGLDLVIYKVQNLYCITKKNDLYKVVSDDIVLKQNFSSRISQHFCIMIDDYSLRYQDLIIYFRNKINQLQAQLYVSGLELELTFEYERVEPCYLELKIEGSLMVLSVQDVGAVVAHNGQLVDSEVYVNLNDTVYVNGFRLDLREAFYYLSSRREISVVPGKKTYEISNDITSDIFIHDLLPDPWTATITRKGGRYFFDVGTCPYHVYMNGKSFPKKGEIFDGNGLFIHDNVIELDQDASVFRKSVFSFRKVVAKNLSYAFEDGTKGLDDVSFDVEYGELMCIMGPSGCGKSTLLTMISGLVTPTEGKVLVDHYNLHEDYPLLKDYIGYVPQDDLLLPNLTVYENLYYHARLRYPDKKQDELNARINVVLDNIRLTDKRNTRVGQATEKTLSGGERKRLNIGLELLSDAEMFFLDEPTSGLSSKDSEKIMELLANIAQSGKIVVVVIHQPGSKLYKMFNKVLVLDNGGRLAYFGGAYSALEYFKRHLEADQLGGLPVEVECPHCKSVQPDILLDSMEASLLDVDGAILGERKYSPDYWKQEYRRREVSHWFSSIKLPTKDVLPPARKVSYLERFNQFLALFTRNYTNKVRDRSNLLITFLEAPLLGAGCGFILKYAPSDSYSLFTNDLFRTFLFISVIVAIFLSMTNSVDEIIGDTALFLRERMLNTSHRGYMAAKILVLMLFSLVQNALFVAMGFLFIEVRELYLPYVLYLSVLSFTGISIGMFISAIPKLSSKAAQNIVPLILIPQIILGGALIEYEKMNVKLTLFSVSPIPEICQFMPSRWAYEGLMILQETGNSYDSKHSSLVGELKDLKYKHEQIISKYGETYYRSLESSWLGSLEAFRGENKYKYGNKNIHDAVNVGESRFDELLEERGLTREDVVDKRPPFPYPMFVREKMIPMLGQRLSTVYYDALVLLAMAVVINFFTLFMLRYREQIIYVTRKSGLVFGGVGKLFR